MTKSCLRTQSSSALEHDTINKWMALMTEYQCPGRSSESYGSVASSAGQISLSGSSSESWIVRRKYLCCHIFVLFDCYLERWMGWWWMSSQIILCRPPKVLSVALVSQQDIQRIRSHSQTHRSTLNWVGTQLKRVSMLPWAWVHPSIMIIIGQLLNVLLLKTLRSMVKYIVSSGIGEKDDIWRSSLRCLNINIFRNNTAPVLILRGSFAITSQQQT